MDILAHTSIIYLADNLLSPIPMAQDSFISWELSLQIDKETTVNFTVILHHLPSPMGKQDSEVWWEVINFWAYILQLIGCRPLFLH